MSSRGWSTSRVRRFAAVAAAITMIATAMLVVPHDLASSVVTAAGPGEPGHIDTFAGNGSGGRGGDGGRPTDAQVGDPSGLAVDTAGNVYVSQASNHVIRRIDTDGVITTIAGTGVSGTSGDGGPAVTAQLGSPRHLAVGPDGALYVAEHGSSTIRRIDLERGTIDTVVSPAARFAETTHPASPTAGFVERPWGLAFGPDGALYVSSYWSGSWIRRVDLDAGTIGTYAGEGPFGNDATWGDGGDRTRARFGEPRGIAFDARGNLLVADHSAQRVRLVDGATGIVTTVLGNGTMYWEDGDGRPAAEAFANFPNAVAVDHVSDAWYVSNSLTLKRVGPDGIAGTVAGLGPSLGDGGPSVLSQLRGGALAVLPDGRILAAEETFTNRVRIITPGLPPAAPAGVDLAPSGESAAIATVVPATGLARLHEVRIDVPSTTQRIDERRNFYSEMPQAVALDPSTLRSTTFVGVDPTAIRRVEARAHNGWGFGPWRTVDLVPDVDPDDPTCRWAVPTSGAWHDASRWSCGGEQRVPTIDDDVVIDIEPGSVSLTVTMSSDAEARSLRLGRMDDARTEQHRLAMTGGAHPNPRVLTIASGPVVIERTGRLDAGRSGVPPGCCSQIGWIARIQGGGGAPVDVVNHGAIEAHNFRVTGDLVVARPPGVADGPGGRITSRGANVVGGTFEVGSGSSIYVVVDRGEEPYEFGAPPRWSVLGGDLTVASGGFATFFLGTNDAVFDGQIVFSVPAGAIVNHGAIRSTGWLGLGYERRTRLDAPVLNHGRITVDRHGLQFGGPVGTVHVNTGTMIIGDRESADFDEATGPSQVLVGRTLRNTGSITIDRSRRFAGAIENAGGTVSRTSLVSTDATVDLGIDGGSDAGNVEVVVSHDGAALPVAITWHGSPHPSAGADARTDGSGDWWTIDLDPALAATSLTAPARTDRDGPLVCGWATTAWDCAVPTVESGRLTISTPLTGVTEWAVGGEPPDAPALAYDLFDADETGPDPVNAVLLGQLSAAVYRWACGPVTCADGVDPDNSEWFDAIAALADEWRFTDPVAYHDTTTGADALSIRTDDALLIAFRGTEGLTAFDDLVTDLSSNREWYVVPGFGLVDVHAGFWGAVDSIYADLAATAAEHPGVPIWLTGHSLGGAMAPIAALRLRAGGHDVRGVHTYGAPHSGGDAFAAVYSSIGLADASHQWVNDRDLVPKLLTALDAGPGARFTMPGRLHVLTRTDEIDELAFELGLDASAVPGWAGAGLEDHDITRTVRRLATLLTADDRAALPAPYGDPPGMSLDTTVLTDLLTDLLIELGVRLDELVAILDDLTGEQVEAIVAAVVAGLVRAGQLVERARELANATAARFGTTLDEFIAILAGLGLDQVTLDAILDALRAEIWVAIRSLLDEALGRFEAWLAPLGLDRDLLPPLTPDDLVELLSLPSIWAMVREQLWSVIDEIDANLLVDERAELEAVVDQLAELAGVRIVHAAVPGPWDNPPTDDDLLELVWRIPLPDLVAADGPAQGAVAGLLDGLGDQLDLELAVDGLDGELAIELRLGVDTSGVYLGADSGLSLSLGGVVDAAGTVAAFGSTGVGVSATAELDLAIAASAPWSGRARPLGDTGAVLAGWDAGDWEVDAAGTAVTSASLEYGPVALTWDGTFVAGPGGVSLTDAAVTGTLSLDGLGGEADPAGPTQLSLAGTLDPVGVWRLVGSLDGGPLVIGPATIDELDVEVVAGPNVFGGVGSASMHLDLGTVHIAVAGTLAIDADGIRLGADRVEMIVADVLVVELVDVQLDLGESTDSPLLTAASATFVLDEPFEVTGTIVDVEVGRDGSVTGASASGAATLDPPLQVSLAGVVDLTLESVTLEFPPIGGRISLDRFELAATGSVDVTGLGDTLGADITILIGEEVISGGEPVTLRIAVDSLDPLVVRPSGVDALTVVVEGLTIGPFSIDATLTVGADDDGVATVSGSVELNGGLGGDTAAATVSVTGTVTETGLVADIEVGVDGADLDGFVLDDLSLSFTIAIGPGGISVPALTGAGSLSVPLGGGEPVSVAVGFGWDGTTVSVDGSLTLPDDTTIADVLALDGAVLTASFTAGAGAFSGTVGLATDRVTLLPGVDGFEATIDDLDVSVDASGTITIANADVAILVADLFEMTAEGATVVVGPNAVGPLLSVDTITAAAPSLGGLTFHITGLVVQRDGQVTVTSATVVTNQVAEAIGIAGFLPFTIDVVELVFTDPTRLDQFELTVTGAFDLSPLADLGITPIVRGGVGGDEQVVTPDTPADEQRFTFTVAVDPDAAIPLRPIDFGPITLGFDDLQVGPFTIGADVTLGGYQDGVLDPTASGSVRLVGGFDEVTGDLEATLTGAVTIDDDGVAVLDVDGTLEISASIAGVLDLEDLVLGAGFSVTYDGDTLTLSPPRIDDLQYGYLAVGVIPGVMTFSSADGRIDLGAGVGQDLVTFGGTPQRPGLNIEFGDGAGPFAGWGGGVSNLALRWREVDDLVVPVPVALPSFAVDVTVPDSATFGLPDWLPIAVDRVGFTLPDIDLAELDLDVELTPELLTGLRLRVSGGIRPTEVVPITAEVTNLEVDLARLFGIEDGFPITNLDGVTGGVEPFPLGPVTVGGVLGIGMIEIDVDPDPRSTQLEPLFYLRVAGEFTYSGIGAGVDVVLTEYGPLLAKVTAPLAMPLAQTTLVLTGVQGGIKFGGDGFSLPNDPKDLLTDPQYDLDFPITTGPDGTIAEAAGRCVRDNAGYDWASFPRQLPPCFTWNDGGTIFLGATLTSVAVAGLISGDVTLAANLALSPDGTPALRFAGNGNINLFGFPVGTAGFLLSLDDPIAPVLDMALLAPGAPGSPLGFVMPATGKISMRLDTEGVAHGALLGAQAFFIELARGSLDIAQDLFDEALIEVAARLDRERSLLVTRRLLDLDGDGRVSSVESARTITGPFLIDRMLGRNGVPGLIPATIPTDRDELVTLIDDMGTVLAAVQEALLGEVAALAGDHGADLAGIDPTDPLLVANVANRLISDDQARAVAAYGQAFQSALTVAASAGAEAFFSVFDPSLLISGELQPILLGVPVGEPTERVSLIINRDGVELSARTSPSTAFLTVFNAATAVVGQLNAQFGLSETLEIRAQLPLTGVIDTLIESGPLALDPFSAEWNVTVEAALRLAGLQIGTLTGIIVSPRNDTVLENRAWRTYDPTSVFRPGSIPITRPEHYAAVYEHGGILVTGQLDAPNLIVDPAATLDAVDTALPESLLDWPEWLTANISELRRLTKVGSFQIFVPGFTNLIDPNYDNGVWTVDYVDDAGRFAFRQAGQQLQDELDRIVGDAYVDAVWDVRLLGADLARGTMTATVDGYVVNAEFPFRREPIEVRLGGSTIVAGGDDSFLPSALFDVEFDSDEVRDFLDSLDLPDLFVVPDGAFSGRLRAATPGYDVASDDLLLVRGGIEVEFDADLPPLLDQGRVALTVLPTTTSFVPDFVAVASSSSIGPLAGITISDAELVVRRLDGRTSIELTGTAEFGGSTVDVEASLNDDLTGVIRLGTGDGSVSIGGFTITGGARIDVTRPDPEGRPGPEGLVFTLRSDISVTLPTWLSELVGITVVNGQGTFSSTGLIDVTLEVDELTIPGTGLRIVGRNAATPVSLRLERQPGGPLAVAISGVLAGADRLPAGLVVDGSLDSAGNGTLTVALPGDGLRAGGFVIQGSGAVERNGTNWQVAIDGTTTVPGVATAVAVSGTIDQDGLVSASLSATALTFGPVELGSVDASIVRSGSGYVLAISGSGSVPGIAGTWNATGNVGSNGHGTLVVSATNLTVAPGFTVTSGSFELERDATGTRLHTTGSLTFASNTFSVSGHLAVGSTATTGSLSLSVPTFNFFGWALTGTFTLEVGASSGMVAAVAELTVPGTTTEVTVSGSLDRFARGHLTMAAQSLPIAIGGTDSQLRVSGTFALRRLLEDGVDVTRFSATNGSLQWAGVRTFTVPDLSVAANGAIDATATPANVTAGVFTLQPPSVRLVAGANGANARIEIGESLLEISNMATGTNRLTVPAFNVPVGGGFTRNLANATNSMPLDALQLEARFTFERVDGVFQFRIRERQGGGIPRLRVNGLGAVDIETFTIRTDGTFETVVRSNRIGPNALSIRNASMDLRKTGSALSTLRLRITGGDLVPRVGAPMALPQFDIRPHGNVDLAISRIIDFGERLRTTGNRLVDVRLDDGLLSLELREPTAVASFPGSSLQLESLRVASDGTFTGTVTGSLGVHGLAFGNVTMALSRSGDTRVRLDIQGGASTNLAPSTFDGAGLTGSTTSFVTGYVRSDGTFALDGTFATGITWAPVGVSLVSVVGSGDIRLRPGSVTVKVAGTATAGPFSHTIPETTVQSSGAFPLGAFNINLFPVVKGWNVAADTVPPALAQPPDLLVYRDFEGAPSVPVNYTVPAATDDRSTPVVSCEPVSGSLFLAGETNVKCTATDGAGNKTEKSFKVTVVQTDVPPPIVVGMTISMQVGGFEQASLAQVTAYSDPVKLGSVVVGMDGVARGTFQLPPDFPPGSHHLVVDGVAPDGTPVMVVMPFTISQASVPVSPAPVTPAPVTQPPVAAPVGPVPTTPVGTLPRTGSSSDRLLLLAALLVLAGVVLRAGGGRRPPLRLGSSGYGVAADQGRRVGSAPGPGRRATGRARVGQGASADERTRPRR